MDDIKYNNEEAGQYAKRGTKRDKLITRHIKNNKHYHNDISSFFGNFHCPGSVNKIVIDIGIDGMKIKNPSQFSI